MRFYLSLHGDCAYVLHTHTKRVLKFYDVSCTVMRKPYDREKRTARPRKLHVARTVCLRPVKRVSEISFR